VQRVLLAVIVIALIVMVGKMIPSEHSSDQETTGEVAPAGSWLERPVENASTDDPAGAAEAERLKGMGYLGSTTKTQTSNVGVVLLDSARVFPGLNLTISGHGPEASLMDMDGKVLHTWIKNFDDVWPKYPDLNRHVIRDREFFSRVHLFENGDLLATFEGYGIFKLDKDSNVLWAIPNHAHHDMFVTPSGQIYTLTREVTTDPKLMPGPILEDFVVVLSPEGKELKRVSLLRAFERSPFAPTLNRMSPTEGDVFHTNTIQVLDGKHAARSPIFRGGNVLFSARNISTVGILDMDTGKVVWALTGMWRRQHQPDLLDNGNMILFDNLGAVFSHLHPYGHSRIIEFDPLTQQVAWTYEGTAENPFQSNTCGTVQRLPNGNTLITESENGQAFEVTPAKEIVWKYITPHVAGERNQFIANLFEVYRLAPDFPIDWISEN